MKKATSKPRVYKSKPAAHAPDEILFPEPENAPDELDREVPYPKPNGLAAAIKAEQAKPVATEQAAHLIVTARAGTGKTTTLVEGLKRMKGLQPMFANPSPQQAAIYESMALSKNAVTIGFVAFNKSIATELQRRVPAGCDAMTMHSMGFKAVTAAFGRVSPVPYAVENVIARIMGRDIRELRKQKFEVIRATEALVSKCKVNLVGYLGDRSHAEEAMHDENPFNWEEALSNLAAHYDIDLNGSQSEVFGLVPKVLKECKNVKANGGQIMFDDMIYLPIVLDLPIRKYDVLLVDECQDLNRAQQQLALKAGKRLILCGDEKQAIYGFAGADCESMPRMAETLAATERGVENLPLTVTYRCGKAIVAEAKKLVEDFDAFDSNPDGVISYASYKGLDKPKPGDVDKGYFQQVQAGDMVLCRVNAPLVSQCFRFIKAGRKALIQGRDIGAGLISTVKKLKAADVVDLVGKLSDWFANEQAKENAKRNPNETRLIALQDRYECLMCFTDGATTVQGVIQKIEDVFTDEREKVGILLSSIHRAKGLEARRVFFLMPKNGPCPHPMARGEQQKKQESHLLYVGITRAIEELIFVTE